MSNNTTSIVYREFSDVPRIFLARHRGQLYLFDCSFDEVLDEYPREYRVYRMPELEPESLSGSWDGLETRALEEVGTVPVSEVQFDPTIRRSIRTDVFDRLEP